MLSWLHAVSEWLNNDSSVNGLSERSFSSLCEQRLRVVSGLCSVYGLDSVSGVCMGTWRLAL